jgi:hypothetical protein
MYLPSHIFRPLKESQSSNIYYWPSRLCGNFYSQFRRDLPVNEKSPKIYVISLITPCPKIVFVRRKLDFGEFSKNPFSHKLLSAVRKLKVVTVFLKRYPDRSRPLTAYLCFFVFISLYDFNCFNEIVFCFRVHNEDFSVLNRSYTMNWSHIIFLFKF